MKPRIRIGAVFALALLSAPLIGCSSKPGVQPKQVQTSDLQSSVQGPEVRAFYQARQWQPAWDRKSERDLLNALGQSTQQGLKTDLFLKGE